MIKVVNINEYVVVVSGILAIVLLCLQIRSTWLKNKDLTKHIEKELLDIKDKTLDIDIKRKKNHIDGN